MGKLRLSLVIGLAACGSNNATPDAHIVVVDAAPDAKVFMDAPPPTYDFSCFGMAAPTTAADPVTIAGQTGSLSQTGTLTGLNGVAVEFYKTGVAAPLATTTSATLNMTDGAFASGDLATGGTPLDGYVKASIAAYRTTFLYPPSKVVANLANVPVPMLDSNNFDLLLQFVLMATQNDTANGVLFVPVTDCALMPINGATLSVKQGATEVGEQHDLGMLAAQAAGTFIVLNVPDGDVTVSASYNGMDFPPHVVTAHKKPNGANAVGTITATAVRPGP